MSERDDSSMSPNPTPQGKGAFDRRSFLKGAGATVAGGVLADFGLLDSAFAHSSRPQPNIVFILVDELRFPMHFPAGVSTAAEWLEKFMPNTFELWRRGVKFTHHYTASVTCSSARAVLWTGLYSQQQWLLFNRSFPSPALDPGFPTVGRLLRGMGYETPYFGKWHLSNPPEPEDVSQTWLREYGFEGHTVPGEFPDPHGDNGEGFAVDPVIADQAIEWLSARRRGQAPFCLVVSLINPHDEQWFWGGPQATLYKAQFDGTDFVPLDSAAYLNDVPSQADPPSFGYPEVPPNWETVAHLLATKPEVGYVHLEANEMIFAGGVTDDRSQTGFTIEPWGVNDPSTPNFGRVKAPFNYWQRTQDGYTLVCQQVDQQVGRVIDAIPRDLLRDTVIVFTSDHGDYAGSHGFPRSKSATAYEEAIRVPLIVTDPASRFTKQRHVERTQLTSSVDMVAMLVTLANGGSTSWMRGDLKQLYGGRANLVSMLADPNAAGRDHILYATDDLTPPQLNFLNAPFHNICGRTDSSKVASYSHWFPSTTRISPRGMQLEFYDYLTEGGRLEVDNTPNDPRAKMMLRTLLHDWLPNEMRQPLPRSLRPTGRRAMVKYIAFYNAIAAMDKLSAIRAMAHTVGSPNSMLEFDM